MDSKSNEPETASFVHGQDNNSASIEVASVNSIHTSKERLRHERLVSMSEDVQIIYDAPPTIIIDEGNEIDDDIMDVEAHIDTTEFVSVPQILLKDEDLHSMRDMVEMHMETGELIRNESDPMDLLMPLERNGINGSDDESNGSGEDSQSGSGSTDRLTKEERWQLWMNKYEWLLHEGTDGDIAYCLYCDVRLNVGGIKYIRQHSMSLYHRERSENYLEFKKMEEKRGAQKSVLEIKQECGTENRLIALKYHRAAQAEALNNFNWMRWMQAHRWLEREQEDGTIGFCKYCRISLNIEFTYLRKRHEQSKGHREAERISKKREAKRLQMAEQDSNEQKRKRSEDRDEDYDSNNVETSSSEVSDVEAGDYINGSEEFCKEIPDSTPAMVRCSLCDVTMIKHNYQRHSKTKMHTINWKVLQEKQRGFRDETFSFDYKKYSKQHPWLTSDPNDPSSAFCSYCQKRFMYGHSEVKRKTHENSISHRQAATLYSNGNEQTNENNPEQKLEPPEENEENAEPENDYSESNEKETKRVLRGSDAWYNSPDYPWCTKYAKDPNFMLCSYCNVIMSITASRIKHQRCQRHQLAENDLNKNPARKPNKGTRYYPWLCYSKNKKIQFCKFCRVRFPNEQTKARHEFTNRHKIALRHFLAKQAECKSARAQRKEESQQNSDVDSMVDSKQDIMKNAENSALQNDTEAPLSPTSMHAKILQWKQRFSWLSYKRNEQRDNYAWCKICDVAVFIPSYKLVSKHQRSGKHIRTYRQRKRELRNELMMSKLPVTDLKQEHNNESLQELQKSYPWLVPDPESEKYCKCKYCNIRLPMKVLYRRNHHYSKKHLEIMRSLNQTEGGAEEAVQNTEEPASSFVSVPQIEDVTSTPQNLASQIETGTLPDEPNENELEDDDSQRSESTALSMLMDLMERSMNDEPPTKRMKHSPNSESVKNILRNSLDSREKMLRAVHKLTEKPRNEDSPLAIAEGILSSSFSIAACLTPMMLNMQKQQTKSTTEPCLQVQQAQTQTTAIEANAESNQSQMNTSQVSRTRNTLELFCDSICETLKSLPEDLAVEGKMKMMQIVYDLEMRAMRRKFSKGESSIDGCIDETRTATSTPTSAAAPSTQKTDLGPIAVVNLSSPTSDNPIIIEDNNETGACIDSNKIAKTNGENTSNKNNKTNTESTTPTSNQNHIPQKRSMQSITVSNATINNKSSGGAVVSIASSTATKCTVSTKSKQRSSSCNSNEQMLRVQKSLKDPTGQVRVMPYNTKTSGPQTTHTAPSNSIQARSNPGVSSNGLKLDLNGSISSAVAASTSSTASSLRHIRVNTSTNSKFIVPTSNSTPNSAYSNQLPIPHSQSQSLHHSQNQQIRMNVPPNGPAPTHSTPSGCKNHTPQNELRIHSNSALQIRAFK